MQLVHEELLVDFVPGVDLGLLVGREAVEARDRLKEGALARAVQHALLDRAAARRHRVEEDCRFVSGYAFVPQGTK